MLTYINVLVGVEWPFLGSTIGFCVLPIPRCKTFYKEVTYLEPEGAYSWGPDEVDLREASLYS